MARRKVEFVTGQYYHLYNRGSNKKIIFREPENYLFLIRRVKESASKFEITVISYCLMPNHYHFLLRQDGIQSVSSFIQSVFNSYTKSFNKAYHRTGTLFEGPFKAIAVETDAQLNHLCRYIHRNPLDAGLVSDLTDWPYSNYFEWLGKRAGTLYDANFVQDQFMNSDDYEHFVLEYVPPKEMVRKIQNLSFED